MQWAALQASGVLGWIHRGMVSRMMEVIGMLALAWVALSECLILGPVLSVGSGFVWSTPGKGLWEAEALMSGTAGEKGVHSLWRT